MSSTSGSRAWIRSRQERTSVRCTPARQSGTTSCFLSFMRASVRGDTCLCYVDGLEPGAVRAQAVGEAGVADPPTDRFDVRPASEVYLQSGKFSVEHMTSVLSDNLEEVVAGGSGLLRVTGEMPWPGVLLQPHGADDFFVYEAALNDVVDQKPAVFMCMYDLQRFGLDMLVAVLKTHPVVLLDQNGARQPALPTRAEYDAEVADPTDRRPLGAASTAAREPDPGPRSPRASCGSPGSSPRVDQQGHRPAAVRVPTHRRCAPEAHLHEARHPLSSRAGRARHAAPDTARLRSYSRSAARQAGE